MGTYYYLVDHRKHLILDLDAHLKEGPWRQNEAVALAVANYMFDNQGHHITILSDFSDEYSGIEEDYKRVDLLDHKFDPKVAKCITDILNKLYNEDTMFPAKYIVRQDGSIEKREGT